MKLVFIGSSRFAKDMEEINRQLSEKEIECQLIEPLVSEDDFIQENTNEKLLEMKPIWTKNHCKKIENSDAVLVVNNERKNIKGYIGPNTLMEIAVAFYFNKPIFFLNEFDENHPFYEEIAGLGATILNGDLSKIK